MECTLLAIQMSGVNFKLDNQATINFQKSYVYIVCFTMAICALFFTRIVFAEQYQLKLIADLGQFNQVDPDAVWLNPLPSPGNNDEFFIAQDNGLIYWAKNDGPNNQEAILNLPLSLNNAAFISLTAISLHPSFLLAEEPGYATFYTAHTTKFDLEKNHNRLTLNDTNINFAFETVITAWSYDFDTQSIDPQTQREVIRIPIKTHDGAIQQLSFDPYLKPWNAAYGQLYFSLGYINKLQDHALYSGVILRISPLLFGARNYTVSQTNPFIKTPEIHDEIVIMGGQNIQHFFWAKYSHKSIFIQHNNRVQYWLSKAKVGVDLHSQSNFLRQQPNEMSSMLLYQGRNFYELRNRMVFFTLIDNQWHLTSLALESESNELPISEKVITTETISPRSELRIHHDNQNEIIIFDNRQSKLYSLQSTNTQIITDNISQPTTSAFDPKYYILFISLLAVLLAALFYIKRNNGIHKLATNALDKEYVRFEYVLTKDAILLFRINHKKAQQTLYLKDITRCEVLLNNNVINVIDSAPENAISNQIEAEIRALFTAEESEKMLDEQTRQIQIILSDKDGCYPIYVYFRKGNNRVTGAKYYKVVDMLIDLCWVISKRLNPQVTETRVLPVVTFSRPNLPVSAKQISEPASSQHDIVNNSHEKPESTKPTAPKPVDQITQQAELVAALDKLVNLHKQGYLSDEEFSLAKNNLLR